MAPPPQQQQQRGGGTSTASAGAPTAAFAAKALITPPAPPLTCLITGCTPGGIGHALALDLASRPGWRVIATARRKDQLKALAELADTLECDVSSQKSIDAAKKQVDRLTQNRGVDVLVNNAGVNVKGTVLDTDMAAIERLMAVNVQGTIAVTKTFAPAMAAKRRGLIVNVGSAAGYTYGPIEACYAASKAAVRALTDGLRVEMAPLGVKVMLVAPGFVKTRIDDQPGRSSGSSGGGAGAIGTASGLWFPPRARNASGGGGGGSSAAAPSLDASASSPYALYGWLSRMVRTSIFELGPGVLHDTPQAFAARLGAAIVAEVPRAPRPVPLLARRALAAAAAANKPNQGRGSGGGAGGASTMTMGPLPPPSALDMVAGWRWWAPHALGGPRRHFRAAPFAVVTWLVGALAPLWVADLVLGMYMGLWTAL